jgi:hypothetical protein
MSVWRRKAIECMPKYRQDFEKKGTSIYEVFFTLLGETVRAHQSNDTAKLKDYYAFAEWCLNQRAKDLWNAAGVFFYEHLADQEETSKAMPLWVKRSIYTRIRGLLVFRIGEDRVQQLDALYQAKGLSFKF